MEQKEYTLVWKVHVPNLLTEILDGSGMAIYERPLQRLARLLAQVAERAAMLNDPLLNALMCQLTLYVIADPEQEDYDPVLAKTIIAQAAHPHDVVCVSLSAAARQALDTIKNDTETDAAAIGRLLEPYDAASADLSTGGAPDVSPDQHRKRSP